MAIDSPYQPGPGARPAVLVGREAELSRAYASLTRTANSRTAASSVLVLTGSRGLGKTVTLGAIEDDARMRGFITASATFDSVSSNIQRLGARIAAAAELDPASGSTPGDPHSGGAAAQAWQRMRRRLETLSIEINAGIIKVTTNPAASSEATSVPEGIQDREALVTLMVDGAALAAASGKAGLAIVIDELQEAPHGQLVTLANAFQEALAHRPSTPLAIFAAGLPHTPERVIAAASFAERMDFRTLGRLDTDAASRALLEPALQVGVSWDDAAANAVINAAGGSPYLIQRLGDEAWLRAQPDAGAVIDQASTRAAINDTREGLAAGMFRGRWVKATPAEQGLMAAIAHVADTDGIASTADITAALGRSSSQLSMARKGLLDKGLVESTGMGKIRFTMPGFDEFVRDQTDLPPAGPNQLPPSPPHPLPPPGRAR